MSEQEPGQVSASPPGPLGFVPGRADLAAILALLGSLVVFFAPVVFRGEVFFFRDVCLEIVPKRFFLAHSGGEVLWNPLSFFGMPAAANPQWSAFYPLNFIFHLGETPGALGAYVMVHFGAALIFTYLLARAMRGSVPAGLAAALAFAWGGFMVSCGNQVVMLNSAAWIMPLLWAALMAMRTADHRYTVLAGLFWSMQVLGGEAEIALLSFIILALFMAALLWGRKDLLLERGNGSRAAFVVCVSVAVALAVSAPQWLLTLEMTSMSNRSGGLPPEDALKWSLEPQALLTLLAPNYITDPVTYDNWVLGFRTSKLPYLLSVYPGMSALLLALLACLRAKRPGPAGRAGKGEPRRAAERKEWTVFFLGSIFFILLALGRYGGIYGALHAYLPGFDRFRIPERCVYGFAVFAPLMAARGMDRLISYGKALARERPGFPWLSWITAAVTLGLGAWLAKTAADAIAGSGESLDYQGLHQLLLAASRARVVAVLSPAVALVALVRTRPRLIMFAAHAGCLILFADLYLAHRHVNPTIGPEFYSLEGNIAEPAGKSIAAVLPPPGLADRTIGAGRNLAEFYKKQRKWVQPFTALELGLRDVLSRSSFYISDAELWKELVLGGDEPDHRLLAASGVKWILRPGDEPMKAGGLPRAYVVPEARWLPDRESVLEAMKEPGFDPHKVVLLEGRTPQGGRIPLDNIFQPMPIMKESNHRVEVLAGAKNPGWLVLLDTHYPGWKARLNGKQVPVYRANGFFRAVQVGFEGGVVEFYYRPLWFYAGALICFVTLMICAGLLVRRRAHLLWWLPWALLLIGLPMIQGGTTYLPVTALRVIALLFAAAWSWSLWKSDSPVLYRSGVDLWVLGLLILAGFSFVRSEYFYISFYWYVNVLVLVFLFYFTVQFCRLEEGGRRAEGVMALLVTAGAIQSGWAVMEWSGGGSRASAGYFNPAFLAGAVMAVSPYALARSLMHFRRGRKLRAGGGLALLLLLCAGVLASKSRAAVVLPPTLALAAYPAIKGAMIRRGLGEGKARNYTLGAVLLVSIMLAAALAVFPNPVRDRLLNKDGDPYAMERINIWKVGLKIVRDHPLGVGPGMFKYHAPKHRFAVEGVPAGRYEKAPDTAHNEYIHTAAEMSPLATIVLAVPAFMLMAAGIRRASAAAANKAGTGGGREAVMAGSAAGLFAIAAHALFDSNLHNHSIAVMAAVMAGVLSSELSRERPGRDRSMELGRGGRTSLTALLTLLLVLGAPGLVYLAWGYAKTMEGSREQDPARAVLLLREATAHSLGNAATYKHLSSALYRLNLSRPDANILTEAVKAAKKASELNPADPDPYRMKAQHYLSLYFMSGEDRFKELSKDAFSKTLELDPKNMDAHLGMALLMRAAGDKSAEIKWWRRALEIEPYDLGARARLVRALVEQGETREAWHQWKEFTKRRRRIEQLEKERPGRFESPYRRKRVTVSNDLVEKAALMLEQAARGRIEVEK